MPLGTLAIGIAWLSVIPLELEAGPTHTKKQRATYGAEVQSLVGAALENFPAQKRKKFWFHVRKKNRSKKHVTKNNSCHPQNR